MFCSTVSTGSANVTRLRLSLLAADVDAMTSDFRRKKRCDGFDSYAMKNEKTTISLSFCASCQFYESTLTTYTVSND